MGGLLALTIGTGGAHGTGHDRDSEDDNGKPVACPRNLPAALNPPADAPRVAGLPMFVGGAAPASG